MTSKCPDCWNLRIAVDAVKQMLQGSAAHLHAFAWEAPDDGSKAPRVSDPSLSVNCPTCKNRRTVEAVAPPLQAAFETAQRYTSIGGVNADL